MKKGLRNRERIGFHFEAKKESLRLVGEILIDLNCRKTTLVLCVDSLRR